MESARHIQQNTLGLDDDLDTVELIQEIERAFSVSLPDERLQTVNTVGQLFSLVREAYPTPGAGECPSSMTFYRLRRAIEATGDDAGIRPGTLLGALRASPRHIRRRMRNAEGLEIPSLVNGPLGNLGGILLLMSLPVFLLGPPFTREPWVAALGLLGIVTATFMFIQDGMRFSASTPTIGDLTREIVNFNRGPLFRKGARPADAQELWLSFRRVVASQCESIHAEDIVPDTVILQSEFDRLRSAARR